MADVTFLSSIEDVLRGNIDFDTDVFYALLTLGFTPVPNTHDRRDDVTGEVTGTGYTAGGQVISVSISKNTTTGIVTVTFGAVSWASSTISADGMVIYKRRGGAASADELVAFNDFGSTIASSGAAFNVAACTLEFTRVA